MISAINACGFGCATGCTRVHEYIRIQLKKNQTLKKNSVDINRSLL